MAPDLAPLLDGRGEPPARPVRLRAGPLTVEWWHGDLRYVRYGGLELIRRVYFALRDDHWATVPIEIAEVRVHEEGDRFEIAFTARNDRHPHRMTWRATIRGTALGVIRFEIEGSVQSPFVANRVGFCLLHPAEAAGSPVEVRHVDGAVQTSRFPDAIAPHQPFCDIRSVRHTPRPGVWCEAEFEGDAFEMEDQRNWSDASFKTYCTPLHRSIGASFEPGQSVRQAITLRLEAADDPPPWEEVVGMGEAAEVGAETRLGLVYRPGFRAGAGRLVRCGIRFLRVEVATPDDLDLLRAAAELANRAAIPLELAVGHRLRKAGPAIKAAVGEASVRGIVVVSEGSPTTDPEDFLAVRRSLRPLFPDARWGAGSRGNFTELNRVPPSAKSLDYVGYPVHAQVHAFENVDILETSATHGEQVRCARRLFPAQAVAVGPISIGPLGDPRRGTPLEAAWALASLVEVSAAGAVTACHDTDLETEQGPTPLATALEALGGAPVRKVCTTDPLRVVAFDTLGESPARWLVNLSAEETRVAMPGYRRVETPEPGRDDAVLSPYSVARFRPERA